MSLRFCGFNECGGWPVHVFGGRRLRRIQNDYRRSTWRSGSSCGATLLPIRSTGFNQRHETISPPAHGFDKARVFSAVVESTTHLGDDRVQAVIEVDKDVRGPKLGAQFLTRHYFIRVL